MKNILRYLSDLENNNNREWYQANRLRYQEVRAEFELIVQQLISALGQADQTIIHQRPRDLIYRIARDARFSRDKSPYNPSFRAHIAPGGKSPIPVGYYLHIAPQGRSLLAGGLYASDLPGATAMVRDYIAAHGRKWASILKNKDFAEYFAVKGAALKRVPKDYAPDHPQAESLKNKSWYLDYPVPDQWLARSDGFVTEAARVFLLMKPFNDFLNQALRGFQALTR